MIWLWVNTYFYTIFSGLFTSIYLPAMTWGEQKHGTRVPSPHPHISCGLLGMMNPGEPRPIPLGHGGHFIAEHYVMEGDAETGRF